MLEDALRQGGINARVIDAGVSGDTTAGGLSRVEWSLTPEIDAMILALGANDMLRGLDPEVARLVLDGRVDFGLATLPVREPRLETRSLFDRQDVGVCGADHPLRDKQHVSLAALAEHPLISLEQSSVSRALLDRAMAEADVHPQTAMELGSIEVIKHIVAAGLGVGIVPEVAVRKDVESGLLHSFDVDGLPSREVGLVTRAGEPISPAASAFVETLIRLLGDLGLESTT